MSTSESDIRSELEFRLLDEDDLPDILAIERKAFSTPWRDTTFGSLFNRLDSDLIGAFRGDRLVGYAVTWTVGDQSELGNVAVDESERGRGVGRKLVEQALDGVRRRGSREVFLEVRESNVHAQELYQAVGFRVISRRKNYYSRPREDALVMRLALLLAP